MNAKASVCFGARVLSLFEGEYYFPNEIKCDRESYSTPSLSTMCF